MFRLILSLEEVVLIGILVFWDVVRRLTLREGSSWHIIQPTLSVVAMEEVVIDSTQAPGEIGPLQMDLETAKLVCHSVWLTHRV
jgi:hypothetical protein